MDGTILAHGIGGAQDLPVSPSLAIAGAVAALAVSFVVLALAWRTPRFRGEAAGASLPGWCTAAVDSLALRVALRLVGLAIFGWAVLAAVFGKDQLINPFFGMFYVWTWVGLVPASLLFGPAWRALSPARTFNLLFAKVSGGDPDVGLFDYPERLGLWPAALGLYAFVWLELVYPYSTELGPVRLWFAAYVAIMLLGGALFGTVFHERADPFEVYSSLVARLSIWGRRDGELVVRSPLANLDTVVPRPGLVAVVSVLFGSTAFDSFKESTHWVQFIQTTPVVSDHDWANQLANNLGLLVFCLGVGVLFKIGTSATAVGPDVRRGDLARLFAHSVVPIIVGYVVAHYLSYFLEVGQDTLIKASDPLSTGANYLGTGNWGVDYWISYHPTFLAVTKVVAVVLGHVLGVVAAHDRAVRVLPPRHQVTGQLPLLVTMVGFTIGGLYLLFAA